jgi:hypothetical protein
MEGTVELAIFFFSLADDFVRFRLGLVVILQGGTGADDPVDAELDVPGEGPPGRTINQVVELHVPFPLRRWVETQT